jgi:hypothetical protein
MNPASVSSRITTAAVTPCASPEPRFSRWCRLAGLWRKVYDDHAAALADRPQDAGVHARRVGEVMVDEPHEDGVAAIIRQTGFVRPTLDNSDVREPGLGNCLTDFREALRIHVRAEDAAGRPDPLRHANRQRSAAGADVGNR